MNFFTFLLVFFFAGTFMAQTTLSEKNYKIISSKNLKEISIKDIVTEMKNYDVIFFGEEHNDSVTHYLQFEVFKELYNAYDDKAILSMEMFETDCQMVLDEYLKGQIREKNFVKEARAWGNYRNYKPMIEFAKEKKLKVVAANAPSRYVNMAARKGQNSLKELSPLAKTYLPPLPYDTMKGAYYEKFTSLMGDTRNVGITTVTTTSTKDTTLKNMPMPNLGPKYVLHSQSLWDASMAYSISKVFTKTKNAKVLQLNGRFHSDEGFGIVTQLKKYNPKLRVLIISSCEANDKFPEITNAAENKKEGDFVIYTDPAVPKTYKD